MEPIGQEPAAKRPSFQELLSAVAAEHERIAEINRALLASNPLSLSLSAPAAGQEEALVSLNVYPAQKTRTSTLLRAEFSVSEDHAQDESCDHGVKQAESLWNLKSGQSHNRPSMEMAECGGQSRTSLSGSASSLGLPPRHELPPSLSRAYMSTESLQDVDGEGTGFFNPFSRRNSTVRKEANKQLKTKAAGDWGQDGGGGARRVAIRPSMHARITNVARRKNLLRSAGVTFANASNWAVNPEHSSFLEKWDQVTMFSLVFVAIVCPIQIAMLEADFDTLFIVNCVIDVVFFFDLVIQFFVMYPKQTSYGTALEHRPREIAKNYLRTWFSIDLASVLPFDLVSILSRRKGVNKIKAVKVIRLLRLIKLIRVMRASRLFRRFEHRMPISYKLFALLKFFVMLLVIIHWMANLWALTLVLVEKSEGIPRWVDTFAELEVNVEKKTADTPWKLYLASAYFTSYTLTSVGYGDIGPQNVTERIVCTVMLIISGTAWAVVLGQVCGIVANMNQDEQAFRKNMDDLNLMMRERRFPPAMRTRLRTFFHLNKRNARRNRHQETIMAMSDGLRGEVAIEINRLWISKVSLLRNLMAMIEHESSRGRFLYSFLVDICLTLQVEVHAQSEIFGEPQVLYILNQGLVSRPPRLHLQGAVWGTDFVLSDRKLLETCESFALTYVEITTITRDCFFRTVLKYKKQCPTLLKTVRRFCCWLAVQRAIMKEATRRRVKHSRESKQASYNDERSQSAGGCVSKVFGETGVSVDDNDGTDEQDEPPQFSMSMEVPLEQIKGGRYGRPGVRPRILRGASGADQASFSDGSCSTGQVREDTP